MPEVPYGYCHCGCGQKTTLATKTITAIGRVKGEPNEFIKGHIQRLMSRPPKYIVDPETGCWVWQGQITPDGYGRSRFEGRNSRATLAHRWYYEQAKGPVPEGLVLDHLCRNRACVNPDHLEPVTIKENILRGEGMAARYARRTHCGRGHELSGENVLIRADGRRVCRQCLAIWESNRRRAV